MSHHKKRGFFHTMRRGVRHFTHGLARMIGVKHSKNDKHKHNENKLKSSDSSQKESSKGGTRRHRRR